MLGPYNFIKLVDVYFSVDILRDNIASYYIIIRSGRPNRVLILKGSVWIISFDFINLRVDFSKKLSTNNTLCGS
jgi:hypothetical protein